MYESGLIRYFPHFCHFVGHIFLETGYTNEPTAQSWMLGFTQTRRVLSSGACAAMHGVGELKSHPAIHICFEQAVIVGHDEIYPLWAMSTLRAGGLEWTTRQIGQVRAGADDMKRAPTSEPRHYWRSHGLRSEFLVYIHIGLYTYIHTSMVLVRV